MAKTTTTTASTSQHKNRYTLPILFFLLLFLITIFLFSKRALEPNLSVYTTDLYNNPETQTPALTSTTETTHLVSDDSEQHPEPDPEIDDKNSKTETGFVDPEVVEKNPVLESEQSGLKLVNETETKSETGFVDPEVVEKNPVLENEQSDLKLVNETETESETGVVDNEVVEKSPVLENGDALELVKKSVEWAKSCNMHMGKWVRDEEYPIYEPGSCPYVDEAFDCQPNGRSDSEYLKWRWKPDDCELPRFNATDFLVRLRGKRLMLVGDSMNRNQFESLLCLLREGLPNKSKMYETHGYRITKGRGQFIFKFEDYNCTVEFLRSHFLAREGVRINAQGNSNPILSIDRIDKTANRWRRADILVFNTGHWWTHGKTSRGKNYYKEGDHVYPKFDAVEAYRRALTTWGRWIDKHLNKEKLVFYRGYSAAHFRGGDWDSGGTCNGEKEPISSGFSFLDTYPLKMQIVEDVIRDMQFPVILLNVTRLTNFRKDGHPSVYGKNVTGQKKVSTRRQDCSHWCLPGVPDAWNELIYATLVAQAI